MTEESTQKWLISFNPNLINKNSPADPKFFAQGFETYEVSCDEFLQLVTSGIAFSYAFTGDTRKSEYFSQAHCLCVDVDGGLSLNQAESNAYIRNSAAFIYTTPSHSPDVHRYRIVFLLEKPIESPAHLTFATRALAQMFGGDISVSDPARMFYGNSAALIARFDQTLSEVDVDDLIANGRALTVRKRRLAFTGTTTSRFMRCTQFTTEAGGTITADQVSSKTVVRCPFHLDTNPSSFLALNDHNEVYHYCSVCCVTRWAPSTARSSAPAIDNFVETMREVSQAKNMKTFHRKAEGIERFMDGGEFTVASVEFSEERYLPDFNVSNGVLFVRSPKGSGKTEFVKREVARLKFRHQSFAEYEESSFEGDSRIYTDTSILLIGHRQALIGEMCERVGLHSYLDDNKLSHGEIIEKRKRYGICLDSLPKIRSSVYDVVIIDEVQQVLAHFLSDTLRGKRHLIWDSFTRLVQNAKKIVCLDADLSWSAFHTLLSLRPPAAPCFVRINEWHGTTGKDIDVYNSRDQLIEQLCEFISAGKRVFVTSNSKNLVLKVAELISHSKRPGGEAPKVFHITSENSKSADAQTFIKDVKKEILNYDAVLASPSLGTGVDISFPDDAQHVDVVVGLFVGGVTDHRDIDQQLLRVRNPKQVCVWIDPAKDDLETDYSAILADVQTRHLENLLEGHSVEAGHQAPDDLFTPMVARIIQDRHKSLNQLKLNFLNYKNDQGYLANFVDPDKAASKSGRDRLKVASDVLSAQKVKAIYEAPCLSLYDFLRVEDRISRIQLPIPEDLKNAFLRTRIERFYQCDVTQELIEKDQDQRLRSKISLYRRLTDKKRMQQHLNIGVDLRSDIKTALIADPLYRDMVLGMLLQYTPLYQNFTFRPDVEITKDDLNEFASKAAQLAVPLRTHVGIKVRADIQSKPTQFLNKLLDLIGLSLIRTRSSGKTGVKQYFYALDPTAIHSLDLYLQPLSSEEELDLATAHQEMADRYGIGWCYITEKYQHKFNDGQWRWMFPGRDSVGELSPRNTLSGHEKWAASVGLR